MVVVHPVGSLQVLLVHSRYLFAVGDRCILTAHPHPDSRSPCDRDLFCSDRRVVVGFIRDSYRDTLSRILDGNGVVASLVLV